MKIDNNLLPLVAPPKNEDLPDLDMLMGTLDGGESELETAASPPPLILPEEKHAKQRRIDELKQGLANEPIELYDEEFEKKMEDEILMIGNISLEMVQVQLYAIYFTPVTSLYMQQTFSFLFFVVV